ncbi:MAG TPA: glycoside hydrolase family 18 protein [bacterium]|nr:glycoside hydrolase family 18 protein [bacterium]
MKKITMILCILLYVPSLTYPQNTRSTQEQWLTAYFAAWTHFVLPESNWGHVQTQDIDWDAFTHLIYFATGATPDGALDPPVGPHYIFSESRLKEIVSAAHTHKTPILYAIGGWGNYQGFHQAITPEVRETFIDNLLDLMTTWGFDGIDIDMEPIEETDTENYAAFITRLHERLQELETPLLERPLLTAAVGWQPELFAELQEKFDQINIMTYDYSNAWRGWVTWHNSPLYNRGHKLPFSRKPLPSVEGSVNQFVESGVDKSKLGIGIDFYGYVWTGVSKPREGWIFKAPTVEDNIPYYEIMDKYYQPEFYHWDTITKASYLSIDSGDQKLFISYDDENVIRAKLNYAEHQNLGGVFIYELGGGHQKNQTSGGSQSLVQPIKEYRLNQRSE